MESPSFTLYAFVEGADLDEVEASVERSLQDLVKEGDWRWKTPELVNQRYERTPDMKEGDLPTWELGVLVPLPEVGEEPVGWFVDIERIVLALGRLHAETGRDFVVGLVDNKRHYSEDIFTVDSERPSLEGLRAIVGLGHAS